MTLEQKVTAADLAVGRRGPVSFTELANGELMLVCYRMAHGTDEPPIGRYFIARDGDTRWEEQNLD